MKQQINEVKRMQLIAGLITESEYRQSLSEEMELPKVGDKFSYEGDEIQITGVDDKFVDAKSTKKDKTYNFGLRSWKEGFKGSKLNEMDEAEMDEAKKKKPSSSSGLITFDQLKQAVFQEYGFEDDEDVIESFKEVNDLGDLVMLLDDLGYNDEEAYEFIIKAILK
jgi:hypothetical protein